MLAETVSVCIDIQTMFGQQSKMLSIILHVSGICIVMYTCRCTNHVRIAKSYIINILSISVETASICINNALVWFGMVHTSLHAAVNDT